MECELKFAPGCTVAYGAPALQSPFIQVHLPKGQKFEYKSSRAVSFCPSTGQLPRGTSRRQQQAEETACAWSWRWYNALSEADQNFFNSRDNSVEPLNKKRRVV